MRSSKKIVLLLLILWVQKTFSQELSNLKDAKPFTMTSSLSANQVFYAASGLDDRRSPYSNVLAGNSNISIYGLLSIPLTFTYSNQQTQYGQPLNFNQFGATPSYKWVKAYGGFSSMSFSPYTLSGHQFLGGGVELTPPGGVRFSAMYGRLRKAVEPDTSNLQTVSSYRRIGLGAKVGYDFSGNSVDVIVFKAYDEVNSIHRVSIDPAFAPMGNLVLGLSTRFNLYEHISLTTEFGGSALTRDTRAGNMNAGSGNLFKYTGFLQTNKSSTAYYKAIKTNVSFKEKTYSVGIGYERIDPEYQTLGSYYSSNDLENITINASKSLFSGKLSIATNVGTQRNNLDNSKTSKMSQLVSSVNVNFSPSQKINMGGSYSNFSSFTHLRSQFENINNPSLFSNVDTLNFTQITQSGTFNCNFQLGNATDKDKRQSMGMNVTVQQASNKQNSKSLNSGSSFVNGNLMYSHSLIPLSLTFSGSINTSYTKSLNMEAVTTGPSVAVTKSFFKRKLNSTLSTSANRSYTQGKQTAQVMSYRLSGSYVLLNRHNFNASFIVLRRSTNQQLMRNFTEFTGMIGYNFSF